MMITAINTPTDGADLQNVQVWVATTPVDMRKSFDPSSDLIRCRAICLCFATKAVTWQRCYGGTATGWRFTTNDLSKANFSFHARASRSSRSVANNCCGFSPARALRSTSARKVLQNFLAGFASCITTLLMTMSVNELPNNPAILKRLLTDLVEQHAKDRRRHAAEAEQRLAQIKEEAAQQLEAERDAHQTAIDEAVKAAIAAILRRYYGPRSE